jgi:predicted enzyme related to lactoylglutathione lyase
MTLRLEMVTFDSTDPLPLAAWWARQTGGSVVDEADGWFLSVEGGALRLGFQKVGDPTPGKNRAHVDLTAKDRDAEVERLVGDGATFVATHQEGPFSWVVLADPDGNQFCVAQG